MKHKLKNLFFLIIIIISCKNVTAKGIEKVWEKEYNSSNWSHIDLFDYTNEYTKYPEHLRGFKELDDSYLIVLKGNDSEDEIMKLSKTGDLIKSIKFTTINDNTTVNKSNYKIENNYIIAGGLIFEDNNYYIKLGKYDFNFNLLKEQKYNIGKQLGLMDRIFINNNSILYASLTKDYNISLSKYDYEFNEIYKNKNIYTITNKESLSSIVTESIISIGNNQHSYMLDAIKEKVIESNMGYMDFFYKYAEDKYNFYGNGKNIGTNYYYNIIDNVYHIFNMNDKLVTKSSTRFLYNLHGKLAISMDDSTNSLFNIYDSEGNLEMTCNMFIITKDGFLVLKKESTNNVVNKLKVERYEIKYNVSIKDSPNGKIKIDSNINSVNNLVKIEILPDSGYVLSKVKITDIYDNEIEYDKEKLIFRMPENDVSIEAVFEKEPAVITNPETGAKIMFVEMLICCFLFIIINLNNKKYNNKIKKI